MRCVLQKVQQAQVDIVPEEQNSENTVLQNVEPQSIGKGLVLLIGVSDDDNDQDIAWLAKKIVNMRIFPDDRGRMNRSVIDVGGQILSISQFTLFADIKRGNRPSFTSAGKPSYANKLWQQFNTALQEYGIEVRTGIFSAHMQVSLVNDGPVTISIDTHDFVERSA